MLEIEFDFRFIRFVIWLRNNRKKIIVERDSRKSINFEFQGFHVLISINWDPFWY